MSHDPYSSVAWDGELIAGAAGEWLGDFQSQIVVPVDQRRFSLVYPTGWTNCTWFELAGCLVEAKGCSCADCCGSHDWTLYEQRYPQQDVDPCFTQASLDGYGVAISPQLCEAGCTMELQARRCNCWPGDTVSCWPHIGELGYAGQQKPAGWPLVSGTLQNPSSLISVVADASGPPGLEHLPAMEIDFSGAGAEGATFVGEGGGYDLSRPPFANSSTPPPGDYLNNYRSATGFTVNPGDRLCFSAWVKAVPDRNGYTCVGYDICGRLQVSTQFLGITTMPFDSAILDGSWQLLSGSLPAEDPPWNGPFTHVLVNPEVLLQTLTQNRVDPRDYCATPGLTTRSVIPPRGRVHVKAVHLAACDALPAAGGLHVWQRH